MSKRPRRILIRTSPHFAKYRLAEELDAEEALISDTAPTPRMVPAIDMKRMERLLRWTARPLPYDELGVAAEVA